MVRQASSLSTKSDGHPAAPGLGSPAQNAGLPVMFNRRAGSPSYRDYRLRACPTILSYPPIQSVTGAKLLKLLYQSGDTP